MYSPLDVCLPGGSGWEVEGRWELWERASRSEIKSDAVAGEEDGSSSPSRADIFCEADWTAFAASASNWDSYCLIALSV